jgi:hypothetical protein
MAVAIVVLNSMFPHSENGELVVITVLRRVRRQQKWDTFKQ